MIIRGKAPVRISFAGGGTDVSPYIEDNGGAVLSATINKYSYATLKTRRDKLIKVKAFDIDEEFSFHVNDEIESNGHTKLIKEIVKYFNVETGFELQLHSDVLPGTGLGSSSTLTTALTGVFRHWLQLPVTEYQLSELTYHIERVLAGIKGGKQDQYAANFGGVNFIEFLNGKTIVNPLRINRSFLNELEYRLVLCYTVRSRASDKIINSQVSNYIARQEPVVQALNETKAIAIEMKNAFLLRRIDDIGHLLHRGWQIKQHFSKMITNPFVDELYRVARKNGAVGGKLLGAGGGGHLLCLCRATKRQQLQQALQDAGGRIVPFSFESEGLQVWETDDRR